jgi:glycosyltransferase involved in cell wall biosynthesis
MVTTFYPPYSFGGDATYLWRLSNALAERGHFVDVVHCADSYRLLAGKDPKPGYPNHPNVTVHSLNSRFGFLSPLATQQLGAPFFKKKALKEVLEDARPDVIHFHISSLVGGPAALKIGSAVKLYTTHEHWLVCPMHVLWQDGKRPCVKPACLRCQINGKRPPQLWRYTGLMNQSLDEIDRFLAPSRFTMNMHLVRGLRGRPFEVLPYFIPDPEPAGVPQETQRPYFLFVGRLEKIKGVQNLLKTFRKFDRADLIIAGDGEYGDELRARAAGLTNVRFLGRLTPDELQRYYLGARAVLVPSICYEVFGIVMLEAFAMSTPVIVNDLGALPEVVEESDGGLTYRDPAGLVAAMNRMLDEPETRDRFGANGFRALGEKWTTTPHLDRYFDIIAGAAERRSYRVR